MMFPQQSGGTSVRHRPRARYHGGDWNVPSHVRRGRVAKHDRESVSAGRCGWKRGLLTHVSQVRILYAPPAQMTPLSNKARSSVARSVAVECASRRFVTREARRRADLRVAVASRNRSTRAFEASPHVYEDQERAVILPTAAERTTSGKASRAPGTSHLGIDDH
jgi:hypothetical protein